MLELAVKDCKRLANEDMLTIQHIKDVAAEHNLTFDELEKALEENYGRGI